MIGRTISTVDVRWGERRATPSISSTRRTLARGRTRLGYVFSSLRVARSHSNCSCHQDQSTFPVYAEAMMGRAPPTATVPSAPIISTSRSAQSTSSRRRSGQSVTHSRPRSGQFPPTVTRIPLMGNNGNTLEGCYFVKEAGLLTGWYWKERWLSLKGAKLTIHCRKTKVRRTFFSFLSHKLNH